MASRTPSEFGQISPLARRTMVTPVIMLVLLTAPLLTTMLFARLTGRRLRGGRTAGCLGMTLVFCFTAIGHFVQTRAMAEMLPPWVPGRVPLVYVTGVIELTAAFAVLVPRIRPLVGWGLIAMLVLFLPVNVYAAVQRSGMGGHQWGPVYLLIRVPLQAILIGWIWWFAVRARSRSVDDLGARD